MAQYCPVCSVSLGVFNNGILGSNKLKDGSVICSQCRMMLNESGKDRYAYQFYLQEVKSIYETYLLDKLNNLNPFFGGIKTQIRTANPELYSMIENEMNKLPDIVMEEEKIVHAINGYYNNVEPCVLFASDSRLIFVGSDWQNSFLEIIPYEKVNSVKYLSNQSLLAISTKDNSVGLNEVPVFYAWQFCEEVTRCLEKFGKKEPEPKIVEIDQREDSTSIIELLERLGALREKGILTEEEFSLQKMKLLERL